MVASVGPYRLNTRAFGAAAWKARASAAGRASPQKLTVRSQGSIKVLSPYLGQTVKFGSSLPVEKGDIVALTVPTWAPTFAEGLPANNVWRASRAPGTCTNATDIRQGEPQQTVGKRATYGCRYSTARLLYTATLVEGP